MSEHADFNHSTYWCATPRKFYEATINYQKVIVADKATIIYSKLGIKATNDSSKFLNGPRISRFEVQRDKACQS